ncbi:protease modulator HflC [Desulfovibrio psychrotolerans]|uniref:Protein HflC n=1 Tax=Desulfovibrio psychrotolerans TaxID=415242 RepID=A0A7J0BQJ3_9BACT|nr:protease modulator HflC [Desulfovibrio psychrotolerans]GFM35940.1 protein HflC [Desulfovibrio psychrotolerans]
MSNRSLLLIVGVCVAIVVFFQSAFTVHQTQRALVLQLGKPVGGILEPGLHFKLPFVQNVIYLDSRVLDYDTQPAEAITQDKKALVMDNYVRWRIVDPLRFYQTVRTIPSAQARLEDIVYSQLRVYIGQFTLTQIVSEERIAIMDKVTKRASEIISEYGIEIIDVRIKRTDLPAENQRAIFGRMQAERERQAKQYRSEGQQESTTIRSTADKEQAVILAQARREASIIRGEGEARAARVFAEALSKAPDFYEFQRSLETYRKSFKTNTRILLSTDDPFLKHME